VYTNSTNSAHKDILEQRVCSDLSAGSALLFATPYLVCSSKIYIWWSKNKDLSYIYTDESLAGVVLVCIDDKVAVLIVNIQRSTENSYAKTNTAVNRLNINLSPHSRAAGSDTM
jgi:hypothetical protein